MLHLNLSLFIIVILFSGCVVIPTYISHVSLKPGDLNKKEVHASNTNYIIKSDRLYDLY